MTTHGKLPTLRRTTLHFPEHDATLIIREPTLAEIEPILQGQAETVEARYKILAACIIDEFGAPLFSSPDDAALRALPASVLLRAYDALCKFVMPPKDDSPQNA